MLHSIYYSFIPPLPIPKIIKRSAVLVELFRLSFFTCHTADVVSASVRFYTEPLQVPWVNQDFRLLEISHEHGHRLAFHVLPSKLQVTGMRFWLYFHLQFSVSVCVTLIISPRIVSLCQLYCLLPLLFLLVACSRLFEGVSVSLEYIWGHRATFRKISSTWRESLGKNHPSYLSRETCLGWFGEVEVLLVDVSVQVGLSAGKN